MSISRVTPAAVTRRAALGLAGSACASVALSPLLGSEAEGEAAHLLTTAASGLFVRDGIGSVDSPNLFFHRQGTGGFQPSKALLEIPGGSPWRLDGERVVAEVPTPASGGSASIPGSITLNWSKGAITQDGTVLPVSITIGSVAINSIPAMEQTQGTMQVIVGNWDAAEGFYLMSGLLLGPSRTPTPVTMSMSCEVRVHNAPAGSAYVFYLYDLDQPVEDVRFGDGFTLVHLESDTRLREDQASLWLLSGNYDSPSFDPRFACSSLVSATRPARFTWRGKDCGTVLFGELGAVGQSDGKKEIAELNTHVAVLAYLGASMKGTQFCVMNTRVPGTSAASLNGHFSACDGTDFYGELFEVKDHFATKVQKKGGMLALCSWKFSGPYNDWQWPTGWHVEGGSPIYEDGVVVGHSPTHLVADSWHKYLAPSLDGPQSSDIVVHEALPPNTPAERVFGPLKPHNLKVGTIKAGSPVEYRAGHCNDRTVVGEDYGPFSWSFTGENANRISAATARLHYMVFCADGVWHEILYEGADGLDPASETTSAKGERIVFGNAPCGFFSGGIAQHLPVFGNLSLISEMCRELPERITSNGEWILNPLATSVARGAADASTAVVRVGTCTYLAGETPLPSGTPSTLGNDGFMGWHFTGSSPLPPTDEELDGWSGSGGFVGDAWDNAADPAQWSGVHVEDVAQEGLATAAGINTVRSYLPCVKLVEGDNYVWAVNHATVTFGYLNPGEHGGGDGMNREHGTDNYSNELDYAQNGVCVYDATPEAERGGSPYDVSLPNRLDVRVGRTYRLKPYLANVFTPKDYDLARWDERWTRWSWQGWHTNADDGGGIPVALERRFSGDETLYTGWKVLDAEGVETVRRYNR